MSSYFLKNSNHIRKTKFYIDQIKCEHPLFTRILEDDAFKEKNKTIDLIPCQTKS